MQYQHYDMEEILRDKALDIRMWIRSEKESPMLFAVTRSLPSCPLF